MSLGRYVGKYLPWPTQEGVVRPARTGVALGPSGQRRLGWMDWYRRHGENASLTCRYFGISRKTFHQWKGRYEVFGVRGLEDGSRAPHRKRQPEITWEQELRVKALRTEHIRWGKEKMAVEYAARYGEAISAWKIYRVTELKRQGIREAVVQCDTKAIWTSRAKRYVFAGIEQSSKVAFARMYLTGSSRSARDFLVRLVYLMGDQARYMQSDNGSEYHRSFEETCQQLELPHYYSRVKTPTDNAVVERFIRTIEEGFLQLGNYVDDVEEFNRRLTNWLVLYNSRRPHQSLGYLTPLAFLAQANRTKVLPMYPTYTTP